MPTCPNCQADTITDAQYCEACGYRLASSVVHSSEHGTVESYGVPKPDALPGSLRAEIPFLSGAVKQARARLESWKEQAERDKLEARREKDLQRQEEDSPKKRGRRSIWLMLVGVLVLVLWVFIIVRWPPGMNPAAKWQLLHEMLRRAGWEDEEA
ncbi:MAG: zinc ribbon domain-containing protein [Candidatus Eremiobacterota bacterium]